MKKSKNTAAVVFSFLKPVIEDMGYMLWDVEYAKEGTEWTLRITIDSKSGIGIEDCEAVHRAIDPILDQHDPIENSYRLEVSSPGIERTLRTDSHFTASIGEEIEIKLFRPIDDGRRILRGMLRGYEDRVILFEDESGTCEIARADAAMVKTVFDF